MFWMPDQVRHDGIRLFTGASGLFPQGLLRRPHLMVIFQLEFVLWETSMPRGNKKIIHPV
ncbi:MAG: hypothetical protein COX19_14170 [Desulfobacterales bacterium CG23_combo_of_CG06-09_8_20_14_all_51_8]|nr:MAG: hypothetical protein COX19_14170 [Desulfobacterales bacterium CG23_combo_of_CG06-09_8_20_14_all_51_8]